MKFREFSNFRKNKKKIFFVNQISQASVSSHFGERYKNRGIMF